MGTTVGALFDAFGNRPTMTMAGETYYIIWFLPNTESVGEVRNYSSYDLSRYRRIGISLGDSLLPKMNTRFLVTEWTNKGPKIRVSKAFMTIPRSLREAGIWHEVGHIHNGHPHTEDIRGPTQPDDSSSAMPGDRILTMRTMEEAADRFAVLHSSKEALKGFLEHLLRARSSTRTGEWNEIERRELEARIASIRGY